MMRFSVCPVVIRGRGERSMRVSSSTVERNPWADETLLRSIIKI